MHFLSFISLVEKGMWAYEYLQSCCHLLDAFIEVPGPTLWNPVQLDQDSYQYRLPEIQTSLNLHVYCDLKNCRNLSIVYTEIYEQIIVDGQKDTDKE